MKNGVIVYFILIDVKLNCAKERKQGAITQLKIRFKYDNVNVKVNN